MSISPVKLTAISSPPVLSTVHQNIDVRETAQHIRSQFFPLPGVTDVTGQNGEFREFFFDSF
jgi:hypothetical protein